MKAIRTLIQLILITAASLATAEQAGRLPEKPQIHRPPAGEYQHLWLTFDGSEPTNLFVGLREGKSTVAWFVGGTVPGGVKKTGAYRVLIDSHELAVKGETLSGKIVLRQVSIWAPMQLLAEVSVSIDAMVDHLQKWQAYFVNRFPKKSAN